MADVKPIRYHSMDALRAVAMLLGIYLHTAIAWTGIADVSSHPVPGIIGQIIHLFRMQAFFLIAGFFARFLYHRDGWQSMMINRGKRILVPYILGCIILLPITHAMYVFAAARSADPQAPFPWNNVYNYFETERFWQYLHPNYLWFLYYLMLMYVFAVAGHLLVGKMPIKEKACQWGDWLIHTGCTRWYGFIIWGLLAALVMLVFRVPVVDLAPFYFYPQWGPFGLYFLFFMAGWLIHRNVELLQNLKNRWRYHLFIPLAIILIAVLCFIPVIVTSGDTEMKFMKEFGSQFQEMKMIMEKGKVFDEEGIARVPFLEMLMNISLPQPVPLNVMIGATLYVIFNTQLMWALTFCVVGLFVRFFDNPSPTFRYVADASYWLYLAHGPVVMYTQIEWAYWEIPWYIKNPLINIFVVLILLISYHLVVRSTYLGTLLNGRRYPFRWPWNSVHEKPIR